MNDPAHELTERKLAKAERAVKANYRNADKQLAKLIKSLLAELEPELGTWEKAVENGDKTEAQFRQWKTSRLLHSRRAKKFISRIAELMYDTNCKAAQSGNDICGEVFALNANYALYEYERIINGRK